MSRWWRAEDGSIDHPKLLKLTDAMHRAWYTLMCIASANGGTLPPTEDIALRLRLNPSKVAEWIAKLVAAGLFDNNDGVFAPHNWNKRQYKSDVSTDRVKKHREMKRNVSSPVTRNVSSDVSETVTETAPEAEAKAESETEQSRADASALLDEGLDRRIAGLKLQVEALFRAYKQSVPALDRCAIWLALGRQPRLICESIEKVLKRGKPVSTLDYFDGAIRDTHAAAPPATELQVVSTQIFIVEGTLEWSCWDRHLRETTGRGSPVTDNRDEQGRLRRGWFRPTIVPPGYDEATGERLAPTSEENAA